MKYKNRTPKEIINEIKMLLEQLSFSIGKEANTAKELRPVKKSGPSGGIRMLIASNFFREPKTLPEIVKYLYQEGFHYSRQVISVALLRLVRNRTLIRREAESSQGKEKWIYAERK